MGQTCPIMPFLKKKEKPATVVVTDFFDGRGEETRTPDTLVPNFTPLLSIVSIQRIISICCVFLLV